MKKEDMDELLEALKKIGKRSENKEKTEVKVVKIEADSPEDAFNQIKDRLKKEGMLKGDDAEQKLKDLRKEIDRKMGSNKESNKVFGMIDAYRIEKLNKDFVGYVQELSDLLFMTSYHISRGDIEKANESHKLTSAGFLVAIGKIFQEFKDTLDRDDIKTIDEQIQKAMAATHYDPKTQMLLHYETKRRNAFLVVRKDKAREALQDALDEAKRNGQDEDIVEIKKLMENLSDKGIPKTLN